MLKPMWKRLAWRKPPVTSRYHSPSATEGPKRPKSKTTELPPTLRPPLAAGDLGEEGDDVERDQDEGRRARWRTGRPRRPPCTTLVRWLAHSGQRIPTGVGVMQSGQIGRPQEEQETPVSRLGCR